uniref:Uncharacterized protein n=1 Tax=Rhizophora mucronata TaxID=61149 RepID=A0A2P2PT77_RHIMU
MFQCLKFGLVACIRERDSAKMNDFGF